VFGAFGGAVVGYVDFEVVHVAGVSRASVEQQDGGDGKGHQEREFGLHGVVSFEV